MKFSRRLESSALHSRRQGEDRWDGEPNQPCHWLQKHELLLRAFLLSGSAVVTSKRAGLESMTVQENKGDPIYKCRTFFWGQIKTGKIARAPEKQTGGTDSDHPLFKSKEESCNYCYTGNFPSQWTEDNTRLPHGLGSQAQVKDGPTF